MTSRDIADRIVQAILARRLMPGTRLGEQALSVLFGCSRTLVREALMQLTARGIVQLSSRRGWFVVQPSESEAREAFEARKVIETGLIRSAQPMQPATLRRLKRHIQEEKAALKAADVGRRSFLLGDFHVCLAECLGNQLLADTLRDFTARTTLIAMLYQSSHDANESCQEHIEIVQALEQGDQALAERLMAAHIGHVQATLQITAVSSDPLAELRLALAPMNGRAEPRRKPSQRPPNPDSPSTYLGALL
jgi:DNA-binding GntR family transcriptional regulator